MSAFSSPTPNDDDDVTWSALHRLHRRQVGWRGIPLWGRLMTVVWVTVLSAMIGPSIDGIVFVAMMILALAPTVEVQLAKRRQQQRLQEHGNDPYIIPQFQLVSSHPQTQPRPKPQRHRPSHPKPPRPKPQRQHRPLWRTDATRDVASTVYHSPIPLPPAPTPLRPPEPEPITVSSEPAVAPKKPPRSSRARWRIVATPVGSQLAVAAVNKREVVFAADTNLPEGPALASMLQSLSSAPALQQAEGIMTGGRGTLVLTYSPPLSEASRHLGQLLLRIPPLTPKKDVLEKWVQQPPRVQWMDGTWSTGDRLYLPLQAHVLTPHFDLVLLGESIQKLSASSLCYLSLTTTPTPQWQLYGVLSLSSEFIDVALEPPQRLVTDAGTLAETYARENLILVPTPRREGMRIVQNLAKVVPS